MVRMLLGSLLFAAACSAAHADQPYGPQPPPGTAIAIGIAPAKIRAPYDVQVIREGGDVLPTYAAKDRFYVQGNAGDRYIVKVTNPTARRVEAVVSIDGLDVIDGEPGDLRKRGYVVPPYGEVRIEGFRTSQSDVATFRFSGVDDSYAGKKGKARNVGVIAVAIFEETAPQPEQQIIVGDAGGGDRRRGYDFEADLDGRVSRNERGGEGKAQKDIEPQAAPVRESHAKKAPAQDRVSTTGVGGGAPATRPAPPPHPRYDIDANDEAEEMPMPDPTPTPRTGRPGLGTQFGEQRYSAASFTRFVRAADRPIAVAELRYNNAAGLAALGINAEPLPDHGEIMTRETADPFPGDGRFSQPPR
jgi:hypothetical protein